MGPVVLGGGGGGLGFVVGALGPNGAPELGPWLPQMCRIGAVAAATGAGVFPVGAVVVVGEADDCGV